LTGGRFPPCFWTRHAARLKRRGADIIKGFCCCFGCRVSLFLGHHPYLFSLLCSLFVPVNVHSLVLLFCFVLLRSRPWQNVRSLASCSLSRNAHSFRSRPTPNCVSSDTRIVLFSFFLSLFVVVAGGHRSLFSGVIISCHSLPTYRPFSQANTIYPSTIARNTLGRKFC